MDELQKFLELPDVDGIEEEIFVSDRLGKFKVKPMTVTDHAEYTKRARGKLNKDGIDFDNVKFNLLIVAGQTTYPNFSDSELLKKANCSTAMEFIKRKLKAGEIAEIANQICKISGFDSDINEDIEEAKN